MDARNNAGWLPVVGLLDRITSLDDKKARSRDPALHRLYSHPVNEFKVSAVVREKGEVGADRSRGDQKIEVGDGRPGSS
jgi:hypothetical protein